MPMTPTTSVSRAVAIAALLLGCPWALADEPKKASPESTAATDGQQNEKRQQERIEKIKKLTFDRRPSSLLGGVVDAGDDAGEQAAGQKKRDAKSDKARADTIKEKSPDDRFDEQLRSFRRDVECSRWDAVATFLKSLADKEQAAAVEHLLTALTAAPPPQPGPNGQPLPPEKPVFTASDVVGIARALPGKLDEQRQKRVAALARLALDGGAEAADLAAALTEETKRDAASRVIAPLAAAFILAEAGRADLADPLLPTVGKAVEQKDFPALKLRLRQLRAARGRDAKAVSVDDLWQAASGLMAIAPDAAADRRYAIDQVAELLPQVARETADTWITKLVAEKPVEARELVSSIAARVAAGLQRQPRDVSGRTQWLELLDRAVDAVTRSGAAKDVAWKEPLSLAARAWTAEAVHSAVHATQDVALRRDPYGNVYYWEEQQLEQQRQQMPQWPVKLADALEARPDDAWLAVLDAAERPAVEKAIIRLQCKAGEPDGALPLLERLATAYPVAARELVPAVLDAWKLAHNPNDERTRRMPFFWYFGMEEQRGGIPLSRSLQERNLAELVAFVNRLRALPLGTGVDGEPRDRPACDWIDEKLLVDCFTTCHSVAEVYRPEAIAAVFGPVESLSPTAAARLAEKMRTNLAGTWQKPSVQQQANTKRKEADIRAEVLKGYETARGFLASALRRHSGHWALVGAAAAIAHDENDYRNKIEESPDFTKNRRAALDQFAAAATAYAQAAATLPRSEWQGELFETWFLAGLGACDAGRIDEKTQPVAGESAKVRAVIESMEPEARAWHMDRFAGTLMSRLSKVNPAVKYRVVRDGLVVAGDHPKARDARKLLDYYDDLVREIELRTDIDGPDRVGTGRPFGVLVSLRHTREIEREAGGFGRYLQNQKAFNGFMFNFGRPLENYRDKFENAVRKSLGEFFEVKSVTFQTEDVKSRAEPEYGWRRTPYAYLVLAAKNPKVDRLPPLKIDLDFLDTSGFVILPIESRGIGLDAAGEAAARPAAKIAITQVLDDRKAKEGEVTLEVSATARGLVPEIDTLLDTKVPGFEVKTIRDDGLAVSRFDPEAAEPVVLSERSWAVMLAPAVSGTAAQAFTFPAPKLEVAESILQRYDDADLVTAAPTVEIGRPLSRRLPRWPVMAAVAGAIALVVGFLALLGWALAHPTPAVAAFVVPEPATPFAVLQLLRDIQSNNGLDERGHEELAASISRIESEFFSDGVADEAEAAADGSSLDLTTLAHSWAARARPAAM